MRCHQNARWTEVLPTIMLGIRAAWREDLRSTAAELVYGETLRLPGEFLSPRPNEADQNPAEFVKGLREHFRGITPASGSNHGTRKVFIFKDLARTDQAFVRNDTVRGILQPPYNGPFRVLTRGPKTFTLSIKGKPVTVTIDRLKPAYTVTDADEPTPDQPANQEQQRANQEHQRPPSTSASGTAHHATRSGRRVRFPDRLQVS
ncbi:PREDICTED: uncharacterized protein LOC108570044 [Habropoda laboriosa]|nr:PREDICTED: uncharacterized protein LOC108570044 [Habropoda laboriosa]